MVIRRTHLENRITGRRIVAPIPTARVTTLSICILPGRTTFCFTSFEHLNIKVTYTILRSIASDHRVYNRQSEIVESDSDSGSDTEEEEEFEEERHEQQEENESEGDLDEEACDE